MFLSSTDVLHLGNIDLSSWWNGGKQKLHSIISLWTSQTPCPTCLQTPSHGELDIYPKWVHLLLFTQAEVRNFRRWLPGCFYSSRFMGWRFKVQETSTTFFLMMEPSSIKRMPGGWDTTILYVVKTAIILPLDTDLMFTENKIDLSEAVIPAGTIPKIQDDYLFKGGNL